MSANAKLGLRDAAGLVIIAAVAALAGPAPAVILALLMWTLQAS